MHIARVFLGLVFLGAGINGFVVGFGFDPIAPTSPAAMSLFQFEYLLFAEKGLEVVCGLLLLANRFVVLTLAALAAIIVNIILLHLFLDWSLLPLAFAMCLAYGYLVYYYWHYFKNLFDAKAKQSL